MGMGRGWRRWAWVLGLGFLAAYAAYVWVEMKDGGEVGSDELEPLKLRPNVADPGAGWALLQVALALALIFGASQLFVHQLEFLAPQLGVPPAMIALLLSPVATELPETMNALIWVRQGKEKLALANISGAMMIQATIPSALGIFFTPWVLDRTLLWGAAITMASIAGLHVLLSRKVSFQVVELHIFVQCQVLMQK